MLILCLSFAVTVLDQATKVLVRFRFLPGEARAVIPGLLDLRYVQNSGAAWGMLQGLNTWLVLISLVILSMLVVFRRHMLIEGVLCRVAMGFMVGGIAGNLLDRIRWEYVVDFLDFHARGHHFPAFNVADSAICVGVGLYVLCQFVAGAKPAPRGDVAAAAGPGTQP